MKNSLTIIFLLICSTAYAGDFVCHENGKITSKHYSCGAKCSSRPECLNVSRETLNSITRWYKVDTKIIGTNDQKVVEMTQIKKDAILQAEAEAQALAEKQAIESGEITLPQLLEALESLGITTKKAIIDEVKTNTGISVSP